MRDGTTAALHIFTIRRIFMLKEMKLDELQMAMLYKSLQ